MNTYILLSLTTLTLLYQQCQGAKWHYHPDGQWSPRNWHLIPGTACGGQRQSPINIQTNEVIQADLGEFIFDGLAPQIHPHGGVGNGWNGGNAAGGGGSGNGWWNNWWGGFGFGNGWGQNNVGQEHPQWSNPFGNLRKAKPKTDPSLPFGYNNAPETWFVSDNNHNLPPDAIHGYGGAPTTKVEVSNDGHTLLVSTEGMYTLRAGGLPMDYKPVQLHFHWGNSPERGSEHTMNGHPYAAEVHLVHHNIKYRDIAEALNHSDGLAVIGFFIKSTEVDNPAYHTILRNVGAIQTKGSKVEYYAHLPLRDMLPRDLSCYYRYNGSLTVPKCNENVIWSIGCDAISLGHDQLDMFRQLYRGQFIEQGQLEVHHIEDNFRPTQPLYGRQILRNGYPGANTFNPNLGYSENNAPNVLCSPLLLLLSAIMGVVFRSL